jgi:branched-chain amino acid transport system permease protein
MVDLRRIPRAYTAFNDKRWAPFVKALVGFGLIAALPHLLFLHFFAFELGDIFTVKILIVVLVWAYTAQAWNIMSGYTGQFSFGHAAFFGIGAYATMALVVTYQINPWIGMLVGGVVAGLYAAVIAGLTFRYNVTGHYFALTTLAFAELLRNTVINVDELNGARGYYRPFARTYAEGTGLVAFQFNTDLPYYYLMLTFLILITAIAWGIKKSSIGLYFFAIRENENAAASLGIPVRRYKMVGIVVSAFFTAWAGSFWSMYFTTIRPDTVFSLFRNVEILLPAIVGGPGTVVGPIVGSFLIIPLSEYIRVNFDNIHGLHRTIYGVALVLIVLYSPRGVVRWPRRAVDIGRRAMERAGVRERGDADHRAEMDD